MKNTVKKPLAAAIGATFLANTGSVVIGNSPADIFLFGGGLDVNSLTLGYSTSIAGFISSSATAIHLDRTLLSADATIDTTNGGTAGRDRRQPSLPVSSAIM